MPAVRPLWVRLGRHGLAERCPFCTQVRTSSVHCRRSVWCQQATMHAQFGMKGAGQLRRLGRFDPDATQISTRHSFCRLELRSGSLCLGASNGVLQSERVPRSTWQPVFSKETAAERVFERVLRFIPSIRMARISLCRVMRYWWFSLVGRSADLRPNKLGDRQ
jgi:hypothetical protein